MPATTPVGKTTFFVANQDKIECMSAEKIASLDADIKSVEEENASLALQVKAYSAGTLIVPATMT